MTRTELSELHNITHLANIPSILKSGILSHSRAAKVAHYSVAMEVIQDRRAAVRIPGGRRLHEYANLYINARNKMMRKLQAQHRDLCVLRVSPEVLDLPGVVIADQNASSKYVRFQDAPTGLEMIDRDMVFARSWIHPEDQRAEWRHGSVICAEVLVPDRVPSTFIRGAYVSCPENVGRIAEAAAALAVVVNNDLFFC
jgi:hypothetical protein